MTKHDQLLKLERELADELKGHTIGEQRSIVVHINQRVSDEIPIECVQSIEKVLDEALLKFGMARSKTTKADICEIVYYQFAFLGD